MEFSIREFVESDSLATVSLVQNVFYEYVGNDFTEAGRIYWLDNLSESELIESLKENKIYVAVVNEQIVGVIRIKDCKRITMLYVDPKFQRLGIAKALVEKAKVLFKEHNVLESYLKSSLYAIPIYERLGFEKIGRIQHRYGACFLEMVYRLGDEMGEEKLDV